MSGNLIVVSAPSGGGKTSLVRGLLADDPELVLSVSFTTRTPRPGERNGRDYDYVDPVTFEAMLERGEFLECAEVHGNRYGTSQKWIEEMRACGKDVVLEIDWQGAQQVRRIYPSTTTVFILPPSMEELSAAARPRPGQRRSHPGTPDNALEEISHSLEFDYVIINNKPEEARRAQSCALPGRPHPPDSAIRICST